jgi:AraC-like DNA-binding protein
MIRELSLSYQRENDQSKLSVLTYSFFLDFLEEIQNNSHDMFDEVKQYINKNFSTKITLKNLSRHFCVSISTLSHGFKAKYGISIFEYILDIRLSYARNILIASPKTMTKDLSVMCGFSDAGYFCKAYKNKFGKTPKQ